MALGLALFALVSATLYGLRFLHRPPSLPRAAFKTVFMAALALSAGLAGAPALFVAALAAAAAGDFFLAFDKRWTLGLGILCFLVMQTLYIATFAAAAPEPPAGLRLAALAAVVAISGGFLLWLWPQLKMLALGVVPYIGAIAAMASTAMLLPQERWSAALGAALFLISDGILSAELFKLPPDAPARRVTGPAVWWTYVAAQALIFWAFGR